MITRITEHNKDGKTLYKAQRKFMGMWVDWFAHPERMLSIKSYTSTNKQKVINFLMKAKG